MKITLVNDDGIRSPLLPYILDALSDSKICGEIQFVVPNQERSWISQAITRFEPIQTKEVELLSFSNTKHFGYSCSGTPADCANLAIDNLTKTKPDLLVSGLNVGTNASIPYFLYSGTVGAAKAASLRSIPAIALSLQLPFELFALWAEQDPQCFNEHKLKLQGICSAASATVNYLISNNLVDKADLFSINIPWDLQLEDPKAIFTELQPAKINSIFKEKSPGVFEHNFQGLSELEFSEYSDLGALEKGLISVTPLSYQSSNVLWATHFQAGSSFTPQ